MISFLWHTFLYFIYIFIFVRFSFLESVLVAQILLIFDLMIDSIIFFWKLLSERPIEALLIWKGLKIPRPWHEDKINYIFINKGIIIHID